nr:Zinc knuckle family protein [Ipomoea batatas]
MTSRVLLGTNQPPTKQNVAKEGDFDWLDEDGDLELHWDDEVDDVNVKNTDELVKWREIEKSTSVGEDFSEAISDVLNQIDLEGEKDFVESEDELKNIGSSSDIEGENSLLVYREGDEKKHGFHYKVGMIFSSNSQFKWAVEVHEAVNNKSIKITKNDKRRVQAKCRVNHCNWDIFASRSNPSCPFTIKSFGKHTCGAQQKNKTINSRFLSKYYKEEFKDNENWGRREFQKKVKRIFRCNVSKYQSYRARRNAKKSLIGTQSEQFNMLWDYCEELRISNPGTNVMMKLDTTNREGSRCRFLRLYGQDPIEYTNWFYSVEAYLKSYEPAILPISSSDQWRKTGAPPPLPPKYKPQPGRPKKLRRKDPIEKEHVPTKLGRIGEKKKCGLCGQHGHNKRRWVNEAYSGTCIDQGIRGKKVVL